MVLVTSQKLGLISWQTRIYIMYFVECENFQGRYANAPEPFAALEIEPYICLPGSMNGNVLTTSFPTLSSSKKCVHDSLEATHGQNIQ